MTPKKSKTNHWTICLECNGQGKIRNRLRKKIRIEYKKALEAYTKSNHSGMPPTRPKGHLSSCKHCKGSGLIPSESPTTVNYNYPHIAIIGGGIGGVALAVACMHRGIPFSLFEKDISFNARSQGYGLTLQQASKAMQDLGILSLKNGVVSTRHVVHSTDGTIVGEWGMRKWLESTPDNSSKRTNIHIARQSLRLALLEQLHEHESIHWGHELMHYEKNNDCFEVTFNVKGEIKKIKADLVVGADGIRSTVRKLTVGENTTPLRYLDCIVILGICPLASLENVDSLLLDSATVFQTANGHERIYMMPFTKDAIMWQLSFPISETEAKELSKKGAKALKKEACNRTQWHSPIPQIIKATEEHQITGYPVYDRELLDPTLLSNKGAVTLIGDAAHPMSPFKGQGANQALLDALSLAKTITRECRPLSNWKELGVRKSVLTVFEKEMLTRSASKVKDSADAAQFLHSNVVLRKGNKPRGRIFKDNKC